MACERGGVPADTANMVAMFKTVRSTVCNSNFDSIALSLTLLLVLSFRSQLWAHIYGAVVLLVPPALRLAQDGRHR